MFVVRDLAKNAKFVLLENVYSRKINIKLNNPIFSFTFDDVPITAATNGAKILEDAGAYGTYYVALGMDNNRKNKSEKRLIGADKIRVLHEKGHDIGCHTYNHLNLQKYNISEVEKDCAKNTELLQSILGGEVVEHFAYPLGMATFQGKKILGKKYKTLRTTAHGMNSGSTDLTHLRAISLCSIHFDRKMVLDCIDLAIKTNAWVIFFTHEVNETPSNWGTSIDDFKWVVDQCRLTSGKILNISKAYEFIMESQV